MIAEFGSHCWRWARKSARWCGRRWPVVILVVIGLSLLNVPLIFILAVIPLTIVIGAAVVSLTQRFMPGVYERCRRASALSQFARRIERVWPQVALASGLGNLDWGAPPIGKTVVREFGVSFRPLLRAGEVVQQVEGLAESLRQAVGAQQVRVGLDGDVDVVLFDFLASPTTPEVGVSKQGEISLGATARGRCWSIPLGPSTLVAGSSGSGKASLVWGLLRAIAPEVNAGSIEVHGIDLKGGMELGLGQRMLTRYATEPESAVQLLEEAVTSMRIRAGSLAGITRQHTRSEKSPHVVVLIDELASLTAYLNDRDLTKRANAALSLLLSQGRAVGYTVFACLQDPRKEVIPSRGLFLQTVGLRLRDRAETYMVLGEGTAAVAPCERIPVDRPGTAYWAGPDGEAPELVRAAYVDDDEIRYLADQYPARDVRPVVAPENKEPAGESRRRTGRGRK
ncbi:MAG: FtsK/SpoIIIE domain-containing protein [Solirubrobacterales bacterium]